MRGRSSWAALAVLALAALRAAAQDAALDANQELVQRAFDRTLRAPGVRTLELRVFRAGQLVSRRGFDVAYRGDRRSAQSLVRFTAPSYLRGHALLVLATPDGASDTWLYQAEERRPRRVATTQKADAFYGTDLSFEELEHLRLDHWRLAALPERDAFEARPLRESQYGRLVFRVERARVAIAGIDFFRGHERSPAKRLIVTLDGVAEEAGFLRVRRFRVEQLGRDAWTEVETQRMEIDPEIPAEVFSAAFLEREALDLYALVAARRARGAP
jgi:hypothetical protein